MFALNPVQVGSGGQWNNLRPSLWEASKAKWELGRDADSMQSAYDDLLDRNMMDESEKGPLLQPAELQKKFALPGLEFPVADNEHLAYQRYTKHKALLTHRAMADAAPVFSSWVGAPSWVVGMLGTLTRPLDAGVSLFPFVGPMLGVGGKVAVKSAFLSGASRFPGLIAHSSVPFVATFPRLAPAIVNNMAQQAAVEVPIRIKETQEMGSPDLAQAGMNMVVGAAFAEGIRLAGNLAVKLGSKFVDAAFTRAASDIASGRPVDVSQEVKNHAVPHQAVERALAEERAQVATKVDAMVDDVVAKRATETAKEAGEIAVREGITLAEASRRAENKVAGEVIELTQAAIRAYQNEGYIGVATSQSVETIARSLVKAGDPSPTSQRAGQILAEIDTIRSGADVLAEGADRNAVIGQKLQTLGETLGIKVRKTAKGLPEGTTLVDLPPTREGTLAGMVDEAVAKNSELLSALGDAAFNRAAAIKRYLGHLQNERIVELVEANKDIRIEDGEVVTKADDLAREEAIKESTPDPEVLAEAQKVATDESALAADNLKWESELGDMTPAEKAALDGIRKGFDVGIETTLVKVAEGCILHG